MDFGNYIYNREEADWLREMMEKYVKPCVDYILEGIVENEITSPLQQTIPLTNLNMVTQLCSLIEAILKEDVKMTTKQVLARFVNKSSLF